MTQTENRSREILCFAIGMDYSHYDYMIIERAFEWIEANIPSDEFGINILSNSNSFWEWWNRQWENRNRDFINRHKLAELAAFPTIKQSTAWLMEYYCIHSICSLNIWPNNSILDDTYAVMIDKVFKEHQQHGK